MEGPYPEYPPSYKTVEEIGGYKRTCMVIEILSNSQLSATEIAYIREQLEATADALRRRLASVEKSQIVTPDRFDPMLKAGLRL